MKKIIGLILSITIIMSSVFAAVPSVMAADANVISKKNPAVVIRTSFATGGFSDSWGGVHVAAPIKDAEGYILYDVIIWEDRINLYKFPNNVEQNEKEGFDFSCDVSTKSGLKKYVEWRESFCIKSVKCKNTDNISKCSSTMKNAYISFFKVVKKKSPSKNIILKYSGHGNIGFCGCMNVEDTKATLNKGVSIFGNKFALIDFGTNCQTSNTDFFNVYYPFTNYMLASQFNAGAISMDKWDYETFNKCDTSAQYHNMFKIGESVRKAGENIVKTKAKYWSYGKKNVKKGKIKESMTLLDMREYEDFMKEYSKTHKKIPNSLGKDLYSLIKKYGNSKLKEKYNDFVIYYKDTNSSKNFFKWDSKAYGVTVYDILPTIKLSKSSYVYNGKAQKPTVAVTNYDGRKLTGSSYYKVSYPDGRKNVGEYKVKITIKGSLGSTVYKTFTIKPKSTKITGLTAKNDAFKIKWSKKTTQSTGYQIRYSLKSSFSSYEDVLIKKDTTTSKTIKNLKSKKNYYVKIRTYKTVDGKKIYSAWSSTKKVKTK